MIPRLTGVVNRKSVYFCKKLFFVTGKVDKMAEIKGKKDEGVLERILELMEHYGITDRAMEEYLETGRGMVSHWRNDGRNSYLQYINALCEILKTSPNYLFQGAANAEADDGSEVLSPMEKELIRMYRKVSTEKQKYIKEGLRLFAET